MSNQTEKNHTLEFLLSEANGQRSRDNGELDTGVVAVAGQILWLDTGKWKKLTDIDNSGQTLGIACQAGVGGDVIALITRDAEVDGNAVTDGGIVWTETDGKDFDHVVIGLAAAGIYIR